MTSTHTRLRMVPLLLIFLHVLSACTKQVEPEEVTLQVGLLDNRNIRGVQDNYTLLYQLENPHISFEYSAAVHDPNPILMSRTDYDAIEELTALMEQTPPLDIIILDYDEYVHFAAEGKLLALDDLMRESDFSMDDFHPAFIEGLRNQEDHLLYGHTLWFDALVLAYNKDLFDQADVEYPRDHMTWDELFGLVESVTVPDEEDPIYGFTFGHNNDVNFGLVNTYYALPLVGIPYHNGKMEVNNEHWRKIFSTMKHLYDKEVIPRQATPPWERPEGEPKEIFHAGILATTLMQYSEVMKMISFTEDPSQLEGFEPFDWDIVTVPVHPEARDLSPGAYYGRIMAIHADSQNVEQAWELLAFSHDPKRNERKITALAGSVHASEHMVHDYNMEAFYKLNPAPHRATQFGGKGYSQDILSSGFSEFHAFIRNRLTLDEALENWETEGNLVLQEAE